MTLVISIDIVVLSDLSPPNATTLRNLKHKPQLRNYRVVVSRPTSSCCLTCLCPIPPPCVYRSVYHQSSISGVTATVFGATGFLGGYVSQHLGACGSRAYIPNRGCEMEARHLKPMFDLGASAHVMYSARDEKVISRMLNKSNVVINMIGKYYETKHPVPTRRADGNLSHVNSSFEEINIDIPRRLAKLAREAGVENFVHVSHIGADIDSPSRVLATKAAGEAAVREEFPGAVIVRPATMFGSEDRFLNWYAYLAARLPAVPLIGDGAALVQPIFVDDVAKGIVKLATSEASDVSGKTFELGGQSEFSRREVAEFVYEITTQTPVLLDTPPRVCEMAAWFAQTGIWGPLWTPDLVALEQVDQVFTPAPDVYNLGDLGITPTPIEKIAFSYLHRYRQGGHYAIEKGYH